VGLPTLTKRLSFAVFSIASTSISDPRSPASAQVLRNKRGSRCVKWAMQERTWGWVGRAVTVLVGVLVIFLQAWGSLLAGVDLARLGAREGC
jgi:hypothetical protein